MFQFKFNQPQKEKIFNIPNTLTLSRIFFAFFIIYFIFSGFNIIFILAFFVLAMLTDVLDGFTAKRFNMKTSFGAKFDMIADRFLMTTVVLAFIIRFFSIGIFNGFHIFGFLFILIRDLITVPLGLAMIIRGKKAFPPVKKIGKLATLLQVITVPLFMLSIFYSIFSFSLFFVVLTGAVGILSSFRYIRDIKELNLKSDG